MRTTLRLRFLAAILLLTGCEKPFEPFTPSELAFSIYGHLEATADTQWIRVRPLHASPQAMEGPIDAIVTLEEVETGTVVEMKDSIFSFQPSRVGDANISVHTFFTTMPMVPGRHYRVTATRSDGASTTGTAHIPEFDPIFLVTHDAQASSVPVGHLYRTDYVAMAFGDTDILPECGYFAPIYREFLRIQEARSQGEPHSIWLGGNSAPPQHSMLPPTCPPQHWGEKRIIVVASGEPWPWPRSFSIGLEELLHPSTVNNTEGGVGFFGGTYTRVFPFEHCIAVDGVSCTVAYSARSATLVGKVNDSCTGSPRAEANVRLLESGGNAIRIARTDEAGYFKIQGLNPFWVHSLSLAFTGYSDYASDPLVFGVAAVDTLTFEMERLTCP